MNSFLSKLALFAIALLLATSANASIISEYWTGQNYNGDPYGPGEGGFSILNNSGQTIYGFAVANNNVDQSTYNGPLGLSWASATTTQAGWDGGYAVNWAEEGFNVDTTKIGLFNNFFAGFNEVIIYAYNPYDANSRGLLNGESESGFTFLAYELASPFVTFDQNYALIDTGVTNHVSAVPLPAAAWLFISGIIGLAGVSRRNKANP